MTPMKSRPYIALVLMALLFSGIIQVALAQDILIGLKPGDQFTYKVTGSFSSNAPQDEIPEVISASETEFFKVTIDSVTGYEISYTWFWQFRNGTSMTNSSMLNIETTGSTGPFWAIIPANLTKNSRIHPHYGPDRSEINETVKYLYTNYTRETNRLQLEFAYQNNVTQATKFEKTDTYFDRLTGMLVKLTDETNYQNPAFTTTVTWELIGQNVWTFASAGSSPPEPFFTLPVIIAIAIAVALLVAILAVWVSGKKKKARQKEILRKR